MTNGEAEAMKPNRIPAWLRRIGVEVVGWTLVVLGLLALVLPGPGLLGLAAGLAVLSLRYQWAHRLLHPVKAKAFEAAAQAVQTWPRIIASTISALALLAAGIGWGFFSRSIPDWWPYSDKLWLPGGWGTGAGLILSSLVALGLIAYSLRKFRATGNR